MCLIVYREEEIIIVRNGNARLVIKMITIIITMTSSLVSSNPPPCTLQTTDQVQDGGHARSRGRPPPVWALLRGQRH